MDRYLATSVGTFSARNNLGSSIRERIKTLKPKPLGQAHSRTTHQVSSAFRKGLEQQESRLSSEHCCPQAKEGFLWGFLEP